MAGEKNQYLITLPCGKVLREFEILCSHIRHTTTMDLKQNLLDLGTYFVPINYLSKKKCAVHHGMRNPCMLKVRRYISCMVELDEYLDIFLGQSHVKNRRYGIE